MVWSRQDIGSHFSNSRLSFSHGGPYLDGTHVAFASSRLKSDRSIIELALKCIPSFSMRWDAVRCAADVYSRDLEALRTSCPLSLRSDSEFMGTVVAATGLALQYAMPFVRHESKVVLAAIAENHQAVFFASPYALVEVGDVNATGPLAADVLVAIEKSAVMAQAAKARPAARTAANAPASSESSDSSSSTLEDHENYCTDEAAIKRTTARFPELAKFVASAEIIQAGVASRKERDAAKEASKKLKREEAKAKGGGTGEGEEEEEEEEGKAKALADAEAKEQSLIAGEFP